MYVPVMAPGSRSGVNWTRRYSQPEACAIADASTDLARPGMSSNRMWQPSVISPARTRSSKPFLPTITRRTWSEMPAIEVRMSTALGVTARGLGFISDDAVMGHLEARRSLDRTGGKDTRPKRFLAQVKLSLHRLVGLRNDAGRAGAPVGLRPGEPRRALPVRWSTRRAAGVPGRGS